MSSWTVPGETTPAESFQSSCNEKMFRAPVEETAYVVGADVDGRRGEGLGDVRAW